MADGFYNVMETLVMQKLDAMADRLDCCKCEKCRMDIMAHALNNLPPKYVATHSGELFTRIDSLSAQKDTDITSAVTKAANIVKCRPHHLF